jgi:hypothetical protein
MTRSAQHFLFVTIASCVFGWTHPCHAFTHVVMPGETLAQLASRMYGDARDETILAGANALDVQGSVIVAGMRLEIPAPAHHTIVAGDTWGSLALTWLGDEQRRDVLARLNHAVSWVDPEPGLAVEIPAMVAHIVASDGETTASIAARYWGDANRGWELNAFNGRHEGPLHRGEIVLVWLPDLELSDAGKQEAARATERVRTENDTARLDIQRRADAELPKLAADLEAGRYVEAVARGNRIVGSGPLTRPQLALIYRVLVEAYVALGAAAAATDACATWRANEPGARLDPDLTSPKILAACAR